MMDDKEAIDIFEDWLCYIERQRLKAVDRGEQYKVPSLRPAVRYAHARLIKLVEKADGRKKKADGRKKKKVVQVPAPVADDQDKVIRDKDIEIERLEAIVKDKDIEIEIIKRAILDWL